MSFFQLHRSIRIRILTSFLSRAVGTMIFPFMGIYLTAKLGQGLAGILLLTTVALLILGSFYGGYLADKQGRKTVMVYTQAIQLAAFLLMTLANSPLLDSAWLTFAMLAVQSVSSGMMGPAQDAMLIDVSTEENRGFMYSISYWATNLSIAVGAMAGGLLFASHRFELFVALSLVGLVTLLLTVFLIEESYVPSVQSPTAGAKRSGKSSFLQGIAQSYKLVLSDRRFLLYSLGGLLIFSLERQITNYIAVRLGHEFTTRQIGLGNLFSFELTGIRMLSLIQLENTLLVVCFAILAAKLVSRFKLDLRLLYGGGLLYTLGYSLLGYANSLPLIMIAVLLATAGELVHVPIRQSFLAELIDRDARSSYMAINGLLFQGSKLVGALGISIGAVLPSGAMAGLFLAMGLGGLLLTHLALNRRAAVCEGERRLEEQPV